MKKRMGLGILILGMGFLPAQAQDIPAYALKNVTLHHHSGKVIPKTTLVWRDGKVEQIGTNITIPFDAKTMDGGDSLHVYPGFIDGFSEWATPDLKFDNSRVANPANPTNERAGIQPERSAASLVDFKRKEVNDAKKAGFTMAAIGLKGLMLPGSMDVFYLSGTDAEKNLFASPIALKAAFKNARGVYPSTLMGTIAKFRQLWADASALQIRQKNYRLEPQKHADPGRDAALEALFPVINKQVPFFFEVDNKEDAERLISLKKELNFNFVLVSAKQAYSFVDLLKKEKIAVLVSLDLPKKPEWMNKNKSNKQDSTKVEKPIPDDVQAFRKRQEKAYQDFVSNLKTLNDAGLSPGFSSLNIKWQEWSKIVEALKGSGLSEQQLVQILTVNTAKILGLENQAGQLEKGFLANFTVTDKSIFEPKAKVIYQVIKGELN